MKTLLIALAALLTTSYSFAQKAKNADKKIKESTVISLQYTCPMHPEVQSDKAGTCPKCGINLHASKKEQLKQKEVKGYSCPMHPNEKSDKAGTCAKCGMKLTKNS